MHSLYVTLIWLITGVLILVSLLPLMPIGAWTIRLCDFPRAHVAVVSLVVGVALFIVTLRTQWALQWGLPAGLCILVASWQGLHVVKYSPVWPKELPNASDESEVDCGVAVVNLQFENDRKQEVLGQLQELQLDMLLLIEIDQAWDTALRPLEAQYTYREGVVREEGLGLVLLSKLPLRNASVKHLVSEKRASIFADVELPDGRILKFIGVHPTPPGLPDKVEGDRYDSDIRDAELMLVAEHVKQESHSAWVVTGDFNDVAWSHTTRMFQRIAGLLDPRVGRGLFNTYHAEHWWMRFPIDQVFLSPESSIHQLDRFRPSGSDHFAIIANFSLPSGLQAVDDDDRPEEDTGDRQEADQMIDEGQDAAEDRDEESDS